MSVYGCRTEAAVVLLIYMGGLVDDFESEE
jgi:hypothetical protein